MFKRKKFLAVVGAVILVLSTGAIAFASEDTADTQPVKGEPPVLKDQATVMEDLSDEQREAVQQICADSMEEAIAELVEDGVITQDEADKLLVTKSAPKRVREGYDKTMALTDEQKEAVKQQIAAIWEEAATRLVEKGTLTQEEADAISVIPRFLPGHDRGFGILTEEQRMALTEAMKAKFENSLADLVGKGTITQEQADQILNSMGSLHKGPGGRPGFNGGPGSDDQPGEDQGTAI